MKVKYRVFFLYLNKDFRENNKIESEFQLQILYLLNKQNSFRVIFSQIPNYFLFI